MDITPGSREKLAKSLTAETTELIPFLAYLLQDLWELGSEPEDIVELITKNCPVSNKLGILDLGCGKGAVSIHLAKELGCKVKGIDIMPEFIDYAWRKAREHGVESFCNFVVEDINQSVEIEKNYDIVIFGALGDLLGNRLETILKLKEIVKPAGYIIVDESYSNNESDDKFPTRETCLKTFKNAGVKLVAEKAIDNEKFAAINRYNQEQIIKRANELKLAHSDKTAMFDSYVESQQAECDELEGDLTGVTILLQVK
ncbi:MAG TPA: class I SAM-dependent methyltransferase [Dehalococcoidales bacterium]|nr:class I SAM-dependent methyltransferase [Dehalococcoidales bacterium]